MLFLVAIWWSSFASLATAICCQNYKWECLVNAIDCTPNCPDGVSYCNPDVETCDNNGEGDGWGGCVQIVTTTVEAYSYTTTLVSYTDTVTVTTATNYVDVYTTYYTSTTETETTTEYQTVTSTSTQTPQARYLRKREVTSTRTMTDLPCSTVQDDQCTYTQLAESTVYVQASDAATLSDTITYTSTTTTTVTSQTTTIYVVTAANAQPTYSPTPTPTPTPTSTPTPTNPQNNVNQPATITVHDTTSSGSTATGSSDSASETQSSSPTDTSSGGPSTGTKAGIGTGVGVAIVLLFGCCFGAYRYRGKKKDNDRRGVQYRSVGSTPQPTHASPVNYSWPGSPQHYQQGQHGSPAPQYHQPYQQLYQQPPQQSFQPPYQQPYQQPLMSPYQQPYQQQYPPADANGRPTSVSPPPPMTAQSYGPGPWIPPQPQYAAPQASRGDVTVVHAVPKMVQ